MALSYPTEKNMNLWFLNVAIQWPILFKGIWYYDDDYIHTSVSLWAGQFSQDRDIIDLMLSNYKMLFRGFYLKFRKLGVNARD